MGAEERKEVPRALSRWGTVCREDDAAVYRLSDGTWHAVAGATGPIPRAHVGFRERGEQTGGQGVAGGCRLRRLFHLVARWCPGCTSIWRSAGCFCKG